MALAIEEITAERLAKELREISITEFFEKNKHLLGFNNPTKALIVSVKEAVDNSLDACEEAGLLQGIFIASSYATMGPEYSQSTFLRSLESSSMVLSSTRLSSLEDSRE